MEVWVLTPPPARVTVVGASCAGALLAREAALNQGLTVEVVEKKRVPGVPVRCGEGLARTDWERVGLDLRERWIARRITGLRLVAPDGAEAVLQGPEGHLMGVILDKPRMTQDLLQEAVSRGAALRLGHAWSPAELPPPDGSPHLVVGADGHASGVRRWAGFPDPALPTDHMSCIEYLLPWEGDAQAQQLLHLYGGSVAPGGYAWVFPKQAGLANIGLGVCAARDLPAAPRSYLHAFLDQLGHDGLVEPKAKPLEVIGGDVVVSQPVSPLWCAREGGRFVALVGDAARMIDPLTGGGIGTAFWAGQGLGQALAIGLSVGETVGLGASVEAWATRWDLDERPRHERNWRAKEELVRLTDADFGDLVRALGGLPERLSAVDLLAQVERFPTVVHALAEVLA